MFIQNLCLITILEEKELNFEHDVGKIYSPHEINNQATIRLYGKGILHISNLP